MEGLLWREEEETANNEKEHAKLWFKYLEGGEIKDTKANLEAAANGENFEWTDMYERMAIEAEEEGFNEIAAKFRMVGAITRPPRPRQRLWPTSERREYARATADTREARAAASSILIRLLRRILRARRRRHMITPTRTG